MSFTRTIHLFRQVNNSLNKKNNVALMKQHVRHYGDGWAYRSNGHTYHKIFSPLNEIYMSIAWWWFLWHVYHEYDWVTGEWEVPDPRDWTDEELGIPKED